MSDDATPFQIRERAVLTVFDHSGPEPRAVEEIDVVMENGRLISRAVRAIGPWESSRHVAERAGGGWVRRATAYLRDDWRRTVAHVQGLAGRDSMEV